MADSRTGKDTTILAPAVPTLRFNYPFWTRLCFCRFKQTYNIYMKLLKILAFPFALLYGLLTTIRNKLFDWSILKERKYNIPIIGVGNLSTGGTGKTPHVEYLIKILKSGFKVAALSRGYKRETKGFQIAKPFSQVKDVGDEPLQISLKHPDAVVAVCKKRREGIKKIINKFPNNQAIILDDVFQHRYVKPGLNILLTDYHRIFTENYILPTGNLREFRWNAKRADAIVVTKTPGVFSPLDRKLILKDLSKYKVDNVFFSYIKYGDWEPFSDAAKKEREQKAKTIFLITGIANPVPLEEHLKRSCLDLKTFRFPDHYQFKEVDIRKIVQKYQETFSGSKTIVTTEKDMMRLRGKNFRKLLKNIPVYYIPIEVDFHNDDKENFNQMVKNFVQTFYEENKPTGR